MKSSIHYILLVGIAWLASCTSHDDVLSSPAPIYIGAVVDDQQAFTRAPYTLTAPSSISPLSSAVWMSTTAHSFPDSNQGKGDENASTIAYHNTATFTGETKQLLTDQLYYPTSDIPVYFVGLYPQTGWEVRTTGTLVAGLADYTFDGKTDVMFAPEVSNHYRTAPQYPVLNFHHLLTWLRFKVCAESDECIAAWGKVTKIAVMSKNRLTLSFESGLYSFNGDPATLLPAYTLSDQEYSGQAVVLYTTPVEVAYVLAAPVEATASRNEYTLVVSTEARQDIQVPINLTSYLDTDFVGPSSGHQFVVTLKFSKGDNIMTTVTVSPWENAGSTIIPVGED